MSQGFLLGPDLLARTRRTIETVEGGVVGSGFRAIPTALEGEQPSGKVFRICTFTGAWAINATKTVTFKHQTNTPNTAVVTNLFFPVPAPAGATDCAIAKDGTAWFLIDVPLATATAVFVAATASRTVVSTVAISSTFVPTTARLTFLTGVSVQASLNTANCSITVNTTQTTGTATIVTGGVVSSTVTPSTVEITIIQSTFTSTFLRIGV